MIELSASILIEPEFLMIKVWFRFFGSDCRQNLKTVWKMQKSWEYYKNNFSHVRNSKLYIMYVYMLSSYKNPVKVKSIHVRKYSFSRALWNYWHYGTIFKQVVTADGPSDFGCRQHGVRVRWPSISALHEKKPEVSSRHETWLVTKHTEN